MPSLMSHNNENEAPHALNNSRTAKVSRKVNTPPSFLFFLHELNSYWDASDDGASSAYGQYVLTGLYGM